MRLAVALLTGGALAAASASVPIGDPDLWWHLATARDMVARGFARGDAFSWTAPGAPLATDQWLGQLALYAAYLSGSWTGVLALRTLAVGALIALIVGAAMRRGSPLAAVAASVPAIVLSRTIWSERPELFGAVAFAALVLLLQLEGRTPLYAAGALLPVWANVHGSFALGAVLLLLVAASRALRASDRRPYLIAAAPALLSFIATPAGLGTLTAPAVHLLAPPREIQEWAIPDPTTRAGAIWALDLALVLIAAAVGPRATSRDALLIVPTAVLSLVAIRYTPLFAIAATPFLAGQVGAYLGTTRSREKDPHWGQPIGARAGETQQATLLVAIALLLPAVSIALGPGEPDESAYPVAALAALPAGAGLFNEYDWGGWLIWRAPGTPVFIDGRLGPYRDAVLDDYTRMVEARAGWREAIARRGVRWLLVRPDRPVAVRARDLGWRAPVATGSFVLLEVPRP